VVKQENPTPKQPICPIFAANHEYVPVKSPSIKLWLLNQQKPSSLQALLLSPSTCGQRLAKPKYRGRSKAVLSSLVQQVQGPLTYFSRHSRCLPCSTLPPPARALSISQPTLAYCPPVHFLKALRSSCSAFLFLVPNWKELTAQERQTFLSTAPRMNGIPVPESWEERLGEKTYQAPASAGGNMLRACMGTFQSVSQDYKEADNLQHVLASKHEAHRKDISPPPQVTKQLISLSSLFPLLLEGPQMANRNV